MRVLILSAHLSWGLAGILMAQVLSPEIDTQFVKQGNATLVQASSTEQNFQRWIAGFKSNASRRGISRTTLQQAFRGITYNNGVVDKDRNQSEFELQIWEYLDKTVSAKRVSNGKAALRKNKRVLAAIEKHYGVDKEVVAAIWGMESAFGEHRGDINVIEALSTLAFDGRRRNFFEQQLIAALKILQSGDIPAHKMMGSWAGAMGHTQFIPTSYLAYAVDGTGDGKRDIWSDNPTDALASTAAYLARFGWRLNHPWGQEVILPTGFNYAMVGAGTKKFVADWHNLGIRATTGKPVSDFGRASILLPGGAQGAAFIIFHNFHVIERYNKADAYVIGVGHLADRISGGSTIQADWPRDNRSLSVQEKRELQQRLTSSGFDTFGSDGIIGPNTTRAVQAFQQTVGMAPDGHATLDVLKRLR